MKPYDLAMMELHLSADYNLVGYLCLKIQCDKHHANFCQNLLDPVLNSVQPEKRRMKGSKMVPAVTNPADKLNLN